LNSASLVMIPSGYKEDVVYSQIPTDGSGDLSFTRASNGTRINSAGLVEVCPWNLLQYSEDFSNGVWSKIDASYSGDTLTASSGTSFKGLLQNQTTQGQQTVFFDVLYSSHRWVQIGLGTGASDLGYANFDVQNKVLGSTTGGFVSSIQDFGTYVRITASFSSVDKTTVFLCMVDSGTASRADTTTSTGAIKLFKAQLNIGSTAKPYFPTTDRLNVPRLTYQNGGGGCPSLLLEKQSTNLVTYSEQFDNASWGQVSATITANTTISPDGTQDGDTFTTTGGGARIFQTLSLGAGSYTTSIYVKKLSGSGNMRFFGIVDGSGVSQSFTPTDNWQRFTGNFTASTGITEMQLREDGFSGSLAIWGFQLEASSYATSYIPTTSSSATRVVDACYRNSYAGGISTEATIFADFEYQRNDGGYSTPFLIYNASLGNYLYIFVLGNTIRALCVNSGGVESQVITSTVTPNTRYKVAAGFKTNDFVMYVNGSLIGTDTSGTMPTFSNTGTNIYIGTDASLTEPIGKLNECVLFPTRLTNAELASLTTL